MHILIPDPENHREQFMALSSVAPSPTTLLDVDLIGRMLYASDLSLRVDSLIGGGAYGAVYAATDLRTFNRYAVKAIKKQKTDPKIATQQAKEIEFHAQVQSHPNVLPLYTVIHDDVYRYVVLELCSEGDLFTNITEKGTYLHSESKAISVFLQLLSAVEHCHNMGIYHRDLKTENILVFDQGSTVKLADFGLAVKDLFTTDFGCGSTFYMAPECTHDPMSPRAWYNTAPSDVWSLGVILINLLCGRNPWRIASIEDATYAAFIQDRSFLKTILPITDEFDTLIRHIFEPDPELRLNLSQIRELIAQIPSFTVSRQAQIPQPIVSPPLMAYDLQMPVSPINHQFCPQALPYLPQSRPMSPPLTPALPPTTHFWPSDADCVLTGAYRPVNSYYSLPYESAPEPLQPSMLEVYSQTFQHYIPQHDAFSLDTPQALSQTSYHESPADYVTMPDLPAYPAEYWQSTLQSLLPDPNFLHIPPM